MIMPKKKTSQPLVAQDGVRSDLLKAIRDGNLTRFLIYVL